MSSGHKLTLNMSIRYLDAARVLHHNCPAPNGFWEPLNHLFAMSAELALKAFLERTGTSERNLKGKDVRHSLSTLLLLAINNGLRTSRDVVDALLSLDEAHASHTYRYVPQPEGSEAKEVHSPHPVIALRSIRALLDHCSVDPSEVRSQTLFPGDWLPATLPVRPINAFLLDALIEEKRRAREPFEPDI
jgi:hypothetical protein